MTIHSAEQLFYEALTLQQNNALSEAAAVYRKALLLAPDRLSVQLNLAVVLVGLQQYEEAENICARLLQSNPDDEESLLILGACQSGMGRKEDALATFDRITKINPFTVEAWNGRGNALLDLKQPGAALESYDRALHLAPDHPNTLNNRGNALLELNRSSDALDCYDRALKLQPDYAVALNNRGNALLSLNQTRLAMASFNEAARIQPDYARAHWNESLCRLALGDFAKGWEKYEWGWIDGQRGPKLDLSKPWWDGSYVDGTLLAWGSQGIGDQILFSSMLPELARHAGSLLVAVDPRLVELFQRSFACIKVVAKDEHLRRLQFDAHTSIDGIGQYLRRSWADFPQGRAAYLVADPGRSSTIRQRLGSGKHLCGISWNSTNNAVAGHKSMRLSNLRAIIALDHLQAIDLQYGDTTIDRNCLYDEFGLKVTRIDDIDNFNDIDGLAALIGACDVVVTISNTTAHLAGALGKPTCLLLPYSAGRHWYWHEGRDDSHWYPRVKIFTQSAAGDWDGVIERVKSDLVQQAFGQAPY